MRSMIGAAVTAVLLIGCIGCSGSPTTPTASNQATETFTNMLSNPGPSPMQLTERAPANLAVTTVTCAGGGGATCPAPSDLTVANLLHGGISVNVPPGGTLTFTMTASIGAGS
jgi:hypothetical protein